MSEQKYTAEQLEHIRSTRRFHLRRIIGGAFVADRIIAPPLGLAHPAGDAQTTGGLAANPATGTAPRPHATCLPPFDPLTPSPAQ